MKIPGYDILECLGHSSITEVWKAHQHSLGREVTIKILRGDVCNDPEEVGCFLREARQTAHLKHRHIVQLYNVDEVAGRPFVVMEFVPGPTVARVLDQRGHIPSRGAMAIACEVADALEYAWTQHRLVHRNITPRSLLLDRDGTVKLAYLGLSMRVDPLRPEGRLAPDMIEGTPNYMAPEQADGGLDFDCRTDMYGLGATLYHMITGAIPFGDASPIEAMQLQMQDKLRHPMDLVRDLPRSHAAVLEKLLMKDRTKRFRSWNQARDIMEKAIQKGTIVVRKHSLDGCTLAQPRTARRGQRRLAPHARGAARPKRRVRVVRAN